MPKLPAIIDQSIAVDQHLAHLAQSAVYVRQSPAGNGWLLVSFRGVHLDLHEDGRACLEAFGTSGCCTPQDLADIAPLTQILSHPDVQKWLRQHAQTVVPPVRFPWAMFVAWLCLCVALVLLIVTR